MAQLTARDDLTVYQFFRRVSENKRLTSYAIDNNGLVHLADGSAKSMSSICILLLLHFLLQSSWSSLPLGRLLGGAN